ncbi:Nuclear polyadenylated RNA-binding protein [Quillaja saponaria]|uniref:Nuclear polyadenylated RNA-binding protein n=1 Tax=Quillaja saponaria TaxID=32244 RepID=A0AAD7KTV4_QUISA|nr:Nuclear polyadenylated RNA-binding protein [Quillaja saponaria]
MGCGNSRLNPDGEMVPARIRPLLKRRFEELRRRKNGVSLHGGDGTLSKKELLKDAVEDDESSPTQSLHEKDGNVTSLPKPKENGESKEETVVVMVRVPAEKSSKVVPVPDSESESENSVELNDRKREIELDVKANDDKKVGVMEKTEAMVKTEEVEAVAEKTRDVKKTEERQAEHDHHEGEADDEKQEDEDDNHGENGRQKPDPNWLLCPGSPSFRVYCIESLDTFSSKKEPLDQFASKKESMENKEKEEIVANEQAPSHQKTPSSDSIESSASGNSNEGLEIADTKRKRNRGMKFKRAMRKGGGPMKNFLNVRSCYHPGCGNDRRLLAEKAGSTLIILVSSKIEDNNLPLFRLLISLWPFRFSFPSPLTNFRLLQWKGVLR